MSFTPEQIMQARALAIAYEAVWDVLKMDDQKMVWNDWNHLRVWCRLLREAQKDVGTILMGNDSIERHMATANLMCSKIEEQERELARDMRMHGHEDIPPHNEPIDPSRLYEHMTIDKDNPF